MTTGTTNLPVLRVKPDQVIQIWLTQTIPGYFITLTDPADAAAVLRDFIVVGQEDLGVRQGYTCRHVVPGLYYNKISTVKPLDLPVGAPFYTGRKV